MKNILLLVHEDAGQEARLQVALDVTRALDGHLECLAVMTWPLIVSDFYGTGYEAVVLAEVQEKAAQHRKRLEARLAVEDVPWTMGESFGTSLDALDQASDLADLIVISSSKDEKDKHRVPETLPLRSRRPLLAVPPSCDGLDTAGRALIAWDGSRPCCEAVRAAVPLLRCAKYVQLLEINQPDGALGMSDIARYLSRHGISAELVEKTTAGPVAESILETAAQGHADYIVMGAYSMPRAAEAVFGGVTRTMLLDTTVPLFVAH